MKAVFGIQLLSMFRFCLGNVTDGNLKQPEILQMVQSLTRTVEKLNNEVGVLKKENLKMKTETSELRDLVNKLDKSKKIRRGIEPPIAFTATLTPLNKHIGNHETIVFDHVLTNIGNAYDLRTGKFTCPIKGLYLFSANVMSSSYGRDSLYTEVVKNGHAFSVLYASAGTDSDTVTVMITLEVGDIVWVRSSLSEGQIVHGGAKDNFSGTLIFQLY